MALMLTRSNWDLYRLTPTVLTKCQAVISCPVMQNVVKISPYH